MLTLSYPPVLKILSTYPMPLHANSSIYISDIHHHETQAKFKSVSRLTSNRVVLGGIDNHIFFQSRYAIIIEQLVVLNALLDRAMLLSEILQKAQHVLLP